MIFVTLEVHALLPLVARSLEPQTLLNLHLEPSVVITLLRLAGISSTEVMQLRVQGKKLDYGSSKALLTGRAAFTPGSMNKPSVSLNRQSQLLLLLINETLIKFLSCTRFFPGLFLWYIVADSIMIS